MTREEAIQFLDNMKHEEAGRAIGKDGFYAELMGYHIEALNMAIKALEAPPNDNWEGYSKRLWKSAYEHGKADAEQRWIPVSERLPEEDTEVLITYCYKEGEGDTSHTYVDITTYGDMYFGGNFVHDRVNGNRVKHWREPFEYFTSNYDVIAWMPLPEPYKAESEEV